MENKNRRGLLLIISSPSGVGKTSIVSQLLKLDSHLIMSISITTRPQRPGEKEGQDYHFVDHETFRKNLKNGNFMEYAEVYGNCYGTPRKFVLDQLEKGLDVVFDIDWQGTQQLAQIARNDMVSVFILPPSLEELAKRLRNRGQDSQEIVEKRLALTESELSHWAEYDYVIINDNLNSCVEQVLTILKSERLKRIRQPQLVSFVQQLRSAKL